MSPTEPGARVIVALRRLAAAEPDLGTTRSLNWHERILALRALREAVARHASEQRDRGVPVERVVIELKALVMETLRRERPEMEAAPIREKVVTWCSTAYFAGPDDDETDGGSGGTDGLRLVR